jgi:hypothetical protein
MWQIQWLLQLIPNGIFVWITYLLFGAGLVLYVASKLVSWIPLMGQYRLPAELVGVVALVIAAYFYGGISYREQIAEMQQRIKVAEEKSQQVNTVIETKIIEKIKVVKENVYITREIVRDTAGRQLDAQCSLPRSTVSLHDSASRNEVPQRAESTDGTASGIEASRLLDRVIENYGTCHENAEKLKAWQEWYKEQKKIYEEVSKQ